jgi:hypothetical protein
MRVKIGVKIKNIDSVMLIQMGISESISLSTCHIFLILSRIYFSKNPDYCIVEYHISKKRSMLIHQDIKNAPLDTVGQFAEHIDYKHVDDSVQKKSLTAYAMRLTYKYPDCSNNPKPLTQKKGSKQMMVV